MPPRGYANLSVREDVRRMLDELRAETGIRDLNDLLILLVRTYRDYTNAISKIQELLTSSISKTVTNNTGNTTTSSGNISSNVGEGIAPQATATVKARSGESRRVIAFSLDWAKQKGINVEEYMARKERQGYICNDTASKVYCVWREDIEQIIVELNSSNAGMGDLERVLSGEKLEIARAAIEAGLLWYDNKEKRWRAPL